MYDQTSSETVASFPRIADVTPEPETIKISTANGTLNIPLEAFDEIANGLRALCAVSHETAVSKGWWDGGDRNFPELLCLTHSEISEALEEYRKHGVEPDWFWYDEVISVNGHDHPHRHADGKHKTEGIAAELADTIIRVCDLSQRYNIPLAEALVDKLRFNTTREKRHGGKHA
jgi:NTP pyrophosphatase (non-canonical NTP hydrolase)